MGNKAPIAGMVDCILQEPVRKVATLRTFSYEDIEFGEHIGKGNFGDVWQGVVPTLNNRLVAIKVFAHQKQ